MKRAADRAPQAHPDGFVPGSSAVRLASEDVGQHWRAASYDKDSRSVEAVLATGAQVRRWGVIEVLDIQPGAVDLSRVEQDQVRLLDSHNAYDLEAGLGSVRDVRIVGGQLIGRLFFGSSDRARAAEERVKRGEVVGVSVGYKVLNWERTAVVDELDVWTARRWELLEASLVLVPADPGARVRSDLISNRAPNAQSQETDDMRRSHDAGAPAAVNPESSQQRAAAPPDTATVAAAATARAADIVSIGMRAGMSREDIDAAVRGSESLEQFRVRAFDVLAARPGNGPVTPVSQVVRDESETRRSAMEDALVRRMTGSQAQASDPARPYLEMRLVDMAAECIGHRGPVRNAGQVLNVLQRAFHTTSDFPIIFENAINRSLAARYDVAAPTYRRIARQMTFMDFRPHPVVRPGDFPMLRPIPQSGKIEFGTLGEKKEQAAVAAYAIQFALSRQMLIDDNLGAINDVLARQGDMVGYFEEQTFYAYMLQNSGAGPALLEGAANMFGTGAGRGNLAGTAAAITVASVNLGRAAMRRQKSVDGQITLNITPSILLVGPDKELEAQQLVAPIQAQQSGNVNPFSGTLSIVVSAEITGNAWYLFADTGRLPNFVWGLLDGFAAPRLRIEEPFGVQGVGVSLEHDFGVGAVDYRGGYRNAGA